MIAELWQFAGWALYDGAKALDRLAEECHAREMKARLRAHVRGNHLDGWPPRFEVFPRPGARR